MPVRKETVKDRLERNYLYHYGEDSNCVLCGSLPRQGDPLLWYDYSPVLNTGTLSGDIAWSKLSSGIWATDHAATLGIVTIGATLGNVKTLMSWVYIDTKNKGIIDLDGGTHEVNVDNSGTAKIVALGWDSPTYYVNGVATDVVDVGGWKHIAITTGTAFAATNVVLGTTNSVGAYDGKLALVYFNKNALSAGSVQSHYNNTRHLFGV